MATQIPEQFISKLSEFISSLDHQTQEILLYYYGADQSWKKRTLQQVEDRFHVGTSIVGKVVAEQISEFRQLHNFDYATCMILM